MTDATPARLDLDAIEMRSNAATTGPWIAQRDEFDDQMRWHVFKEDGPMLMVVHSQGRKYSDAEFVAHARTDVPALLAEVRRLQAVANAAREFERVDRQFRRPEGVERAIYHAALDGILESVRALDTPHVAPEATQRAQETS